MRTAVVILNWNGRRHLERFLGSVVSRTPPDIRIIVADNGSTDDSVAFTAENYPTVETILLDRNYGFAEGYNRALAQVDADCFILLNSDVEVTEGWTEPLLAALERDPAIAAVAPKLLSYTERDRFEYAGACGGFIDLLGYPFCRGRILSTVEKDYGQYDSPREVFWASGAAFCCRAEHFRQAGGFDADFFAHMELAGRKIVVEPRSTVYHLGGGTLPNESPNKLYLNYRNNLAMLFKCAPMPQRMLAAAVRPAADMLSVIIYMVKGDFALAAATLRAYRDFLAMHRTLAAKRRAVRGNVRTEAQHIYRSSIILRYMAGRRTFGDLRP